MSVPSSTYRVQLTADFDLRQAADLCRYLAELGVDAVYCSPVLQATPGSPHGYDVTDHDRIDAERGGAAGWQSLVAAARAAGLGVVVDIVPNHMGVADPSVDHPWWDVLQRGRASAFADWFDIEWSTGRIRLPVLGDDVDLAADLRVEDGELRYAEHRFPIAPGTGASGDSPAQVHARQHYELVNFRRADTEQNYRRFFAVTTLAGLRVEDDAVRAATHREILRWVDEDGIAGLRVDHPDGLTDPGGYLDWLRSRAPDAWITVEKILEPGEVLPAAWPVEGTTGYDPLAEVNAVFIDPAGEPALTDVYRRLTEDGRTNADHVLEGKSFIAGTILRAEVNRLDRLVPDIGAADALTELLAAFPTYRSYLPLGRELLDATIETVRTWRPELAPVLAWLGPRLTDPGDELAVRFQQTSGAVMAKGVEDTAYYRYTRFVALNEVGGDPGQFGSTLASFHAAQLARQARSRQGMTTLSTHDTKRGEDVRARLAVLAEIPGEWAALAEQLMRHAPLPNPRFALLLWQTFIGTGFIARERMHGYAKKAMREAREETGWIDPEPVYEQLVHAAVDAAYDDSRLRTPIEALWASMTPAARSNSLAQKLVQLTMPGVPDTYQGTELWEDSLVDPDNRRPVDFAARIALLAELDVASSPPLIEDVGRAKLWLVSRALRLRRARPDLFVTYEPIEADGPAADHVLAFDRGGAITVATRRPVALVQRGGFGDTAIELSGTWVDALTGTEHEGRTPVTDILATYPAALLVRPG